MQKMRFSISDISLFATFPNKWEQRWSSSNPLSQFKAADAVFAFVGGISCFIHSNNLRKLGCSITDCPGFFASPYDTHVALKATSDANAVIYLLSGEKAMSEEDQKAIKILLGFSNLRGRLFFACNKKGNPTITKNIIDADEAILSQLYRSFSNGNSEQVGILTFNALLFFLSQFGHQYLSDIDEYSQQQFLKVAAMNGYEETDVQAAFLAIVKEIGLRTRNSELDSIKELSDSACEMLYQQSDALVTFGDVESQIVKEKCQSILIDTGADKVNYLLEAIVSRLQAKEADAMRTVEESERLWRNSIEAYDSFKVRVEEILCSSFNEPQRKMIAHNGYTTFIVKEDVVKRIALKLSFQVTAALTLKAKSNAVLLSFLKKITKGDKEGALVEKKEEIKKQLHDVLAPVVSDVITKELKVEIECWLRQLYNGTGEDYNNFIKPILQRVENAIEQEWKRTITSISSLSSYGLSYPELGESVKGLSNTATIADSDGVQKAISDSVIDNIIQAVLSELVRIIVAIVVGMLSDLLITGGIGTIATVIYAALTYAISFFFGSDEQTRTLSSIHSEEDLNKNEKNLYKELRPLLAEEFGNQRDKAEAVLKKQIDSIYETFANYYRHQLQYKRDELLATIESARANKKKSLDEQRALAVRAKDVREQYVQPLIMRVSQYVDDYNHVM